MHLTTRAHVAAVVAVSLSANVQPVSAQAPHPTASLDAPAPGHASRYAPADLPLERLSEHVLIVSIDGLRPDAIEQFGAETLTRLMHEGSYSLSAMTIMPSKTLPSHTSMLTGVGPEVHGISWNSLKQDAPEYVEVSTVFDLAHEAGLSTAAFASKAKFRHLFRPGALDHGQAPPSNAVHWMATRTVADAVQYLGFNQPNLLFVHIGEPDFAGHTMGWMGSVYGWAVQRSDAALARLLRAADQAFEEGGYTVIVTSDHGGHDHNHGSNASSDRTIPWIAWGKGINAGGQLMPGIRTMDTAATALWLLGIGVPEQWAGRPVMTALARWAESAPATMASADVGPRMSAASR